MVRTPSSFFIAKNLKFPFCNGIREDIVNAVLFYASDESSFIRGAIQEVVGGLGMPSPLYGDAVTG